MVFWNTPKLILLKFYVSNFTRKDSIAKLSLLDKEKQLLNSYCLGLILMKFH